MNWEDASYILLLILLTVYLIDRFSRFVRGRLIRGKLPSSFYCDDQVQCQYFGDSKPA